MNNVSKNQSNLKITAYGISVVDSEGYYNGTESDINLYMSLSECVDSAYEIYSNNWNQLLENGDIEECDCNGTDFLSKEEFEEMFLKNGYVLIQLHSSHIQFEYFEKEIQLNKEMFLPIISHNDISVSTPLGDIVVTIKTDTEYPGVYVDLKGDKVNDTFELNTVTLATVEFDPNKEIIQTIAYGDANSEEPTCIVKHENVEKDCSIDNKIDIAKEKSLSRIGREKKDVEKNNKSMCI